VKRLADLAAAMAPRLAGSPTATAGRSASPGQAHELLLAQDLVDCPPDVPGVGDKAYAAPAFRQLIRDQGARPVVPARSNEASVVCPSCIYNNRNRVEFVPRAKTQGGSSGLAPLPAAANSCAWMARGLRAALG
jgi:hypothetical protein